MKLHHLRTGHPDDLSWQRTHCIVPCIDEGEIVVRRREWRRGRLPGVRTRQGRRTCQDPLRRDRYRPGGACPPPTRDQSTAIAFGQDHAQRHQACQSSDLRRRPLQVGRPRACYERLLRRALRCDRVRGGQAIRCTGTALFDERSRAKESRIRTTVRQPICMLSEAWRSFPGEADASLPACWACSSRTTRSWCRRSGPEISQPCCPVGSRLCAIAWPTQNGRPKVGRSETPCGQS